MSTTTVTVVVDTFNHGDYIERALESVLQQEYPRSNFDVIVVDDGSTDNTPAVIRKFSAHVRIVEKQNRGQASAFNAAIPLAKGEIVAFLDGDDWWAKNKLQKVIEAFSSDPSIGVVGHGFYEYQASQKQLRAVVPGFQGHVTIEEKADGIAFAHKMCFFGTSRVAIRRRVLNLVGPIPETLVVEADEYMSTVAIANSRAVVLPEILTFYRLHPGNLYYFQDPDYTKMRRKISVLENLSKALRKTLCPAVLNDDVVDALVAPLDLEAKRLRLSLDNGWPWETFQIEREAKQLAYSHMTWKYNGFKSLSLALTLFLPSKAYYRLRRFYGAMNLRRFRRFTGEPTSRDKIVSYLVDEDDA